MADPTRRPGPERTEGDDEEHRLLETLGALTARLDAVPAPVAHAARESFTWRTVDAELAELAYDSLLDDDRLAGVRSVDAPRSLAFEGPELSVEVEVAESGAGRRLLGQVAPGQAGEVEVRHRNGRMTVAVDEVGRFSAADIPAGPVSLRFVPAAGDQAPLETAWTVI